MGISSKSLHSKLSVWPISHCKCSALASSCLVTLKAKSLKVERNGKKMECILGIQFRDFVLLAADKTAARSIFAMKHGIFCLVFMSFVFMLSFCG